VRLNVILDDRRTSQAVVRISIEDLETGETQTHDLPSGDYFLLTTTPAYVDSLQTYQTGTHVITVKGRTK